MRRLTLSTLRKVGQLEEAMIRASMPRTSAADPEPLARFAAAAGGEVLARRSGTRLVARPLMATIAERAR